MHIFKVKFGLLQRLQSNRFKIIVSAIIKLGQACLVVDISFGNADDHTLACTSH